MHPPVARPPAAVRRRPLPFLLAALLVAGCRGSMAAPQPGEPLAEGTAGAAPAPADSTPPAAPPAAAPAAMKSNLPPGRTETATFGGGCFWCIEAVLQRIDGVLTVASGYMGGTVERPTYEQVCTGTTGHAEVVQVTFDPARLPYGDLLDWFFRAHDPTTKDRQGPDSGTQYRSVVFYGSEAQRQAAEAARDRAQKHYAAPIVTEITKATAFWPAEQYHQNFFARNPDQPYCRAMIPPKLKKLGLEK